MTPQTPLSGRAVMVVEDDSDVLKMTAAVVERAGATVVRAVDVTQALAAVGSRRFDAAVVDWNLGVSNADRLLAALRADRHGLAERTVVVTGDFLRRGQGREAERYGCKVLTKPFRPHALVTLLAELIG